MFKYLYLIGQYFRNPSIPKILRFLKTSEHWNIEQLESYQLDKLQELLAFAYEHSTYYKKKFEEHHFHPKDVTSLEDLHKVPILDKNDLKLHTKEIQSTFRFKKLFKATTSGSSGIPLVFLREEYADSFNRASIARGYSWYDLKPWEKNVYFWGFNFSFYEKLKTRFFDFFQHRTRLFSYDRKELFRCTQFLKSASYIHGYSSMIYEVAKFVNNNAIEVPKKMKLIKGTSEKVLDVYQNEVIKAFGSKIINEYGATESGIMAFECPEGHMHINMEGCIIEEHNNEVLVTHLQMKSFPIIRYKLGDYIQLADKNLTCSCGKNHRILKEVTGRIGELIYGKTKTYPSLYFYYVFKNLQKQQVYLNYYIIQNEKGHLNFYIEEQMTFEQKNLLHAEILKYFAEDIDVQVIDGYKDFPKDEKRKSFISKLT